MLEALECKSRKCFGKQFKEYDGGQPDNYKIPIIKDPKIKCKKLERDQNDCATRLYKYVIDPEISNHLKLDKKRKLTQENVMEKLRFVLGINREIIEF